MTKLKTMTWIAIALVLLLAMTFGVFRSHCPSAADRANAIQNKVLRQKQRLPQNPCQFEGFEAKPHRTTEQALPENPVI